MITSVTLGRGAIRMARNHVIVKHLPAIQNFGTIDVFCSDKTGTLTTGEMILDSSVDAWAHRPIVHWRWLISTASLRPASAARSKLAI